MVIGGPMKVILFSTILIFSSVSFAKSKANFKSFNKAVSENISETIDQNPQMYETKPLNRGPASASPAIIQNDSEMKSTDKLDAVEEQADTHISW